jgi:predicted DCC family thiol-disulfide oxidoreductase YuxK
LEWGGHLTRFSTIFEIDLRTLALFRIFLSTAIILDLISRSRDLVAHYTDFGVLPRSVLVDLLSDSSFSLHMANGSAAFQAVLLIMAGLIAFFLLFGWKTRLMTVLSWIFLISIQNRNVLVLSGEDNLILLLTFWSMFLPLGARYSIDAALDPQNDDKPDAFFSAATFAILIQGMSMYFFSAILKSDARWFPDGTAVYFALQLDYLVTPLALWFREFKTLLSGLTYYVLALEFVGPILIFSPIFYKQLRIVFMLAFITMHIGFFLFLEIGLFPLISITMNLLFIPGWVWDKIADRMSRSARSLTIWYDGGCDFCLKICNILRVFLALKDLEIKPAQDHPKMNELMETHNSWIVQKDNTHHLKWSALTHLVAQSFIFWPLSKLMAFRFLQNLGIGVYDLIANNRKFLSKFTKRFLPFKKTPTESGKLQTAIVIVFAVFVFVQNVSTVPASGIQLPYEYRMVRQFLGLYQNWTMFAPYPELDSPWPIIPGELRDGTNVNVYNGKIELPDFIKPEVVSAVYTSSRWRKYIANMEDQSYTDGPYSMLLNYGRYQCRLWNKNAETSKQLMWFEINFNVERTQPPGIPKILDRRLVWTHQCFN